MDEVALQREMERRVDLTPDQLRAGARLKADRRWRREQKVATGRLVQELMKLAPFRWIPGIVEWLDRRLR